MEIIIIILACAGLGYAVAPTSKAVIGAVRGLCLGPLGVLIAVFIKPTMEE